MVRTRDWKLVQEAGGASELHGLQADPRELVNLYNDPAHASIRSDLLDRLETWKAGLPGVERDRG